MEAAGAKKLSRTIVDLTPVFRGGNSISRILEIVPKGNKSDTLSDQSDMLFNRRLDSSGF